jgi:hypothetical protein
MIQNNLAKYFPDPVSPSYLCLTDGEKIKNGIQNSHASVPLRLCRKRTQCQLSSSRFFKIYKQFSDLGLESDLVAMQWGNISISAATQGTTADNSRQQLTSVFYR